MDAREKPGPRVTVCTSLPPPKCLSETVCTSLIGFWSEATYVVISCWLRCEKYGSLWGCRSSVMQMPAYACTDEPLPGSTEVEPFRFPPEQLSWLPLNVWLPANWWPSSCAT